MAVVVTGKKPLKNWIAERSFYLPTEATQILTASTFILCNCLMELQLPCDRKFLHYSNYFSEFQDKFDHDKGQKSAISGRRLHWRLSTGFLLFLQYLCAI